MAVTTSTIAVKDGTGATLTGAVAADPAGVQRGIVSLDQRGPAVYRAAASFTPFGTADRTLISIKGSATKTIRVRRVVIGGTSTASGVTAGLMSRTTALGAGGSIVAPAVAKVDSGTVAAATAVVQHYTTAAQSLGTGPTTLSFFGLSTSVATAQEPPTTQVVFPEVGGDFQAIVLRGAADFLEIGNNAANVTAGAVLWYVVEWEEDAS